MIRVCVHVDFTASVLDDSLSEPASDGSLAVCDRVAAVRSVLELVTGGATAALFSARDQYRLLCRGCAIALRPTTADPKVADWLLDPGGDEKNLHRMVGKYLPSELDMLTSTSGHGLSQAFPDSPGVF